MRVFGAIMFALGGSLLLYGTSLVLSNGITWRLGGLLSELDFFWRGGASTACVIDDSASGFQLNAILCMGSQR